jgi:hypothetical protein
MTIQDTAAGTLAIHQAAANFLASPEFQSRFTAAAQPTDNGGVNDQAFVTQLYQTVLHRSPNATELNYDVQDIQGTLPGIAAQDRAQPLLNFDLKAQLARIIVAVTCNDPLCENTKLWLSDAPGTP